MCYKRLTQLYKKEYANKILSTKKPLLKVNKPDKKYFFYFKFYFCVKISFSLGFKNFGFNIFK